MVRGQRTNSLVARVVHGLTGASWIGADVSELRQICRAAIPCRRTVVAGNAAQVVVQHGRTCGTGTMRAGSARGGKGGAATRNAAVSHPKNRTRPRRIGRASTGRSSQDAGSAAAAGAARVARAARAARATAAAVGAAKPAAPRSRSGALSGPARARRQVSCPPRVVCTERRHRPWSHTAVAGRRRGAAAAAEAEGRTSRGAQWPRRTTHS